MTISSTALHMAVMAVLLIMAACATTPGQRLTTNEPQQLLNSSISPAVVLPSVSDVAQVLPGGRNASYVPGDLLRRAEDFDPALPVQRVAETPVGASFSPDYEGSQSDFDNLSYAMYAFNLSGYEGDATLSYGWNTAPADPSSVMFALANWDSGYWDFFPGTPDRSLNLPDLEPYIAFGGPAVVCVLCTGTEPRELDALRFGSRAPIPALTATPPAGLVPHTVNFDASGSTDPDSTIAEYLWDPEGDGSFELSSGTSPALMHEYLTPGSFPAAVRVVDAEGVYCDLSTSIAVHAESYFTYGAGDVEEYPVKILTTPDGDLIIVGQRSYHAPGTEGMVMRIGPDGTPRFVKIWDGSDDDFFTDAAFAPDGTFYVCGVSGSNGPVAGRSNAVLQNWTPDGSLLWSRTFGMTSNELELYALLVTADSIYACGRIYYISTDDSYGVICRFDLAGTLLWAKTLISPTDTSLTAIAWDPDGVIDPDLVVVCGNYGQTDTNTDVVYASYDANGDRHACMLLGDGEHQQSFGIVVTGFAHNQRTWILGQSNVGILPKAWISRVGTSPVDITYQGTPATVPCDLMPAGDGTLKVLLRRIVGSGYTMCLSSFDQSLSLLGTVEMATPPGGLAIGSGLTRYGASGIAVTGFGLAPPPAAAPLELQAEASALTWVNSGAAQTTLTQIMSADNQRPIYQPDGFEVDAVRAEDSDAFVWLTQ